MEIQQEFIYDVFWEQQLVSVEACLFLFFFWQTEKESLLSTEARKGKKKYKQTKKNNTLQTESTQSS